MSKGHFGLGMM